MKHRPLNQLCGLLASTAVALVLIGCNGSSGANGQNGIAGLNGTNGTNGTNGIVTINAAKLSASDWSSLSLTGAIKSVTVSGQPVVTFSITNSAGVAITGLAQKNATGNYPNFGFSMAKLVPGANGSPSRWVNYFVVQTPAAGQVAVPGFDDPENSGVMIDNNDGTYTYTFALDVTKAKSYADAATYTGANVESDLDDLTFVPTLTHRLIITAGGNQFGSTTPIGSGANLYYDFIPSTGMPVAATDTDRVIVDTGSCNNCHTKLSMHADFFPAITDTHLCVVCHTDQLKYASGESLPTSGTTLVANGYYGSTQKLYGMALANFPNMVHKLHMGENLYYQGYNQFLLYNTVTYPQHIANCQMCHTGVAVPENSDVTPLGGNWNSVPSRLACGACHDADNFITGANHAGGAQADDSKCVSCHSAAAIQVYHTPAAAPDLTNGGLTVAQGGVASNTHTNASYVAADLNNLPAGAHWFKWNIKSVSVNASRQPVWVFQFLQDGVTPVVFNTWTAAQTPAAEMMTGYAGSPNLYMAFAVPQDGLPKPADWNSSVSVNLRKLWRGGAAAGSTFTGPDTNGFYTATLAGVTVPANATMITGGIGYFYGVVAAGTTGDGATDSLQLTQTNLPAFPFNVAVIGGTSQAAPFQGGLCVPNPNQYMAVGGSANVSPRRSIVTTAKCNACHLNLGVFTSSVFHDGQRNDSPTCTFCHNVNGVDSGWGYNIKEVVHSIHSGSKRTTPYTWQTSHEYWNVTYPAILNNCEACHVPGSYDFSNSTNAAALPKLLWTTIASGTFTATATPPALVTPSAYDSTKTYVSPFVTPGVNYGQGLQINSTTAVKSSGITWMGVAATIPVGGTLEPEPTTLVNSPIASACYACHDSATDRAHIVGNGGYLNVARSTVTTSVAGVNTVPIVNNEQCLICHGSGGIVDIKAVHMNF